MARRRPESRRQRSRRRAREAWRRRLWKAALYAVVGFLGATLLLVAPLRWIDPITSTFMLRSTLFDQSDLKQRWVDWDSIAPSAPLAVLASEDQKFPDHFGFDFASIASALDERGQRVRGASTITQQVAKNLYLWPGRSWLRKGLEAWLTAWVEILWPKRRILEIYLNVAEFGPGVFGVEAASQAYFGKPARSLGPFEASILAAVLPNPRALSAARPSAYVRGRAREISQEMRRLGGRAFLRSL